MPTQGFNVKSLVQNSFKLNVWDIGGQSILVRCLCVTLTYLTEISFSIVVTKARKLFDHTGEITTIKQMPSSTL